MPDSWKDLMEKASALRASRASLTAEQQERLDAVNARNDKIQHMSAKPADGVTWGKKAKG